MKLNASLTAPSAAPVVIATVGPWTIAASCEIPGVFTQGDLRVQGPGNAEYGLVAGQNDTGMEPVSGGPALSSSFPEPIFTSPTLTNGSYYRAIGTVILDDGTNVAILGVNFFVDARSVHTCRVTGSAIPTS